MLLLNSIFKNVHLRGYTANRALLSPITGFRCAIRSYYDVLGLPNDCTTREIKDAYIRLSKEYHPDRNKKQASHNQFIKVLEAYSILSKPERRRMYDNQLKQQLLYNSHFWNTASTPYSTKPFSGYGYDDPTFWMNRKRYDNNRQYEDAPYGIPGMKKLSNEVIALICIFLTSIGVALQLLTIRYSTTLKRDKMLKESEENEKILADVREAAIQNGNDHQIEVLEKNLRKSRFYRPSLPKE